jgi:hypothetical protein
MSRFAVSWKWSGMRLLLNPALWAIIALSAVLTGHGAQATPTEFQVKAAFLLNFAKFVDWPASKFSDADAPLIIGVTGESPVAEDLDRITKNKIINNRKLVIRRVAPGEDLKACHLLFITRCDKQSTSEWLGAASGMALVTVGETAQFLEHGGIINFYLDSDTVKFEVNSEAAEKAGLKISSKLLNVAKKMKEEAGR